MGRNIHARYTSDRIRGHREIGAMDEPHEKPVGRTFTLQEIQQIWQAPGEQERRDETQRMLDMYANQWLEQLAEEIDLQYLPENRAKQLQKADTTINLARWVSKELGGIYDAPAHRTVDGTSDGLEPYENQGALDDCLAEAAPLAFLTRELFLRPVIQFNGAVVIDILTPDRVSFVQNQKDPTEMDAFIIDLGEVDIGATREQMYSVWTSETHHLLNASWEIVDQPENPENMNPYGVIPWVKFNADYPAVGKWHISDSFALRDATLITGIQKTDHNHLRHFQSHLQLAINSDESDQDKIAEQLRMMSDASSCLHWRGGQFHVLDMQANLREHLESMLMSVGVTLNMYGIRPEAVRGSIDASSGFALSIKMHKQRQVWLKYQRSWTRAEKKLYQVTLKVRPYELNNQGITADPLPVGELDIAYGNIGPEANPLEQADLAAKLKAAGWSDRMIQREVFGWDDEKIDQNQQELLDEQSMFSPMPVPVATQDDEEEDTLPPAIPPTNPDDGELSA